MTKWLMLYLCAPEILNSFLQFPKQTELWSVLYLLPLVPLLPCVHLAHSHMFLEPSSTASSSKELPLTFPDLHGVLTPTAHHTQFTRQLFASVPVSSLDCEFFKGRHWDHIFTSQHPTCSWGRIDEQKVFTARRTILSQGSRDLVIVRIT